MRIFWISKQCHSKWSRRRRRESASKTFRSTSQISIISVRITSKCAHTVICQQLKSESIRMTSTLISNMTVKTTLWFLGFSRRNKSIRIAIPEVWHKVALCHLDKNCLKSRVSNFRITKQDFNSMVRCIWVKRSLNSSSELTSAKVIYWMGASKFKAKI